MTGALVIVQPETVIAWHRRGFGLFWSWRIRLGQPGRPRLPREVRDLIRRMCRENPTWGTLHTHQSPGEWQHSLPACLLGFDRAGLAPVGLYQEVSPSHLQFPLFRVLPSAIFTVPTLGFQVLYVFLVLAHDRLRILHFNVTAHPTAEWSGQQLREAFPLIGSIRRECLDHVIVFHESSLRRTLSCYFQYYHRSRTHLSLGKDSPEPRSIEPPAMGSVVAVPQVGGLHHRYERRAA